MLLYAEGRTVQPEHDLLVAVQNVEVVMTQARPFLIHKEDLFPLCTVLRAYYSCCCLLPRQLSQALLRVCLLAIGLLGIALLAISLALHLLRVHLLTICRLPLLAIWLLELLCINLLVLLAILLLAIHLLAIHLLTVRLLFLHWLARLLAVSLLHHLRLT